MYVDYGNVEIVDEIYEWNPICNKYPLQALTVKVHGIKELETFVLFNDLIRQEIPLIDQIMSFLWNRLYTTHKAYITYVFCL